MRRHLAIAAVALLWLVGCPGESVGPTTAEYESERARLSRRAQAPPEAPGGAAAETEAVQGFGDVEQGYSYDPTGKRDPFRSFVLDLEQMREDERGPLEQFELNQLGLLAVVWDAEKPRALIGDPSGQGYIVREGTRIGKNQGRIVRIDDGSVVVKEIYVDYLGDRTSKEIEMRIRQVQGG